MGMTTQSASPINHNLSWDFNTSDVLEGQDAADNEILTALVRTSYLKHLQRSLTNNYDLWLEKNEDNEDFNEVCHDDIIKCANFLEHRALRACMITSYYQRAMVKTMKEIKQSTEEGSLFSPLIEQIFDNKSNCQKKVCDKETQTNISLMKLSTNECHSVKPEKKISSSKVDIALENSNLIIISPRNDVISEEENNDVIEDLFNILMHSPSYPENETFNSPKKRKYSGDEISLYNKETIINKELDVSLPCCDSKNNDSVQSNPEYLNNLSPLHKSKLHSKTHHDFAPPPEDMPNEKDLFSKVDHSGFIKNEVKKSNLDERLQSLAALFGECSSSPEEPSSRAEVSMDDHSDISDYSSKQSSFSLPLDWRTEYVAQNCNLKVLLSRMTSHQRHQIHKRFRALFGSERTHHTYISTNEEALSRKRTANLVVGELTPHYIAGRIASRDVFKALAKKITDELLLLSYIADPDEIGKKVCYYFENGRSINSLRDIENIQYS